eukprot:192654-Prorocentrum_minimum.AAC.1
MTSSVSNHSSCFLQPASSSRSSKRSLVFPRDTPSTSTRDFARRRFRKRTERRDYRSRIKQQHNRCLHRATDVTRAATRRKIGRSKKRGEERAASRKKAKNSTLKFYSK